MLPVTLRLYNCKNIQSCERGYRPACSHAQSSLEVLDTFTVTVSSPKGKKEPQTRRYQSLSATGQERISLLACFARPYMKACSTNIEVLTSCTASSMSATCFSCCNSQVSKPHVFCCTERASSAVCCTRSPASQI